MDQFVQTAHPWLRNPSVRGVGLPQPLGAGTHSQYKPSQESAFRVELRSPDPACNPYLAFACILVAGFKGMEDNLNLPDPVEEDISILSHAQIQERGIATLSGDLASALETMDASTLVQETLGEHIFSKFLQNKRTEWELFRAHVTDFERERYLPRL